MRSRVRSKGISAARHGCRTALPLEPSLIRLRPHANAVTVSRGETVLITDLDGAIDSSGQSGLFVHETRLLSRYRYTVNGSGWHLSAQSNVEQHAWLGYYVTPANDPGGAGNDSQQTIELRLTRCVGHGMHEDVDLANYSLRPVAFTLGLEVDGDFADLAETTATRRQWGPIRRRWRGGAADAELALTYTASHRFSHQDVAATERLTRGVILRVEYTGSATSYRRRAIGFHIRLPPQGRWHACVKTIPVLADQRRHPESRCYAFGGGQNPLGKRRPAVVYCANGDHLNGTAERARARAGRDLTALTLDWHRDSEGGSIPAAGIPTYVALFGRDTLVSGWHAAMRSPAFMYGALSELANWQGTTTANWRDEEPGRVLHEAHAGPLAMLCYIPQRRYYGSLSSSALYPIVLGELWRWTGDRAVVKRHLDAAVRALQWLDAQADDAIGGFYRYRTRSTNGLKNQFWKDSNDAVVYEDGTEVPAPIAICEVQGAVYLAKIAMADVLHGFGEVAVARRLVREARDLKTRFNDAFWMPDAQFFAMGLDPDGRQIRSIGSDPGHCLADGIVDPSLAGATASRLLEDDLFSGWGVRTLSSSHPAFDPYAYHRGTVWPVDQAFIAAGFERYRLFGALETIARGLFEAAAQFDHARLPELFAGHARDALHPFPGLYSKTNWPQAWSAAALLRIVAALLGLHPYAPLRILAVDPHLPSWLPELTIDALQVGSARITLHFVRDASGVTHYEVLARHGSLQLVRHRPRSNWDSDAPWLRAADPA